MVNPAVLGLFGQAVPMGTAQANPIAQFEQAERMQAREMELTRKDPMVRREIDRFMASLHAAKDPEALLGNRQTLEFILRALQMKDQIGNDALARKAMLSDPEDSGALASRLSDKRYRDAARMFEFAGEGLAKIRDPDVSRRLIDSYVQQRYEERLAERNPAIPDAFYFRRVAESRKLSAYDVLGDPILRRVVLTATALPQEIAFQSVEAQARAVEARVDLGRLQEPRFRESFLRRFLVSDTRLHQQQQPSWQLGLLSGARGAGGFSGPGILV